MNNPGIKHDSNKPDYSLLPPRALHELVKVLDFGARKYDRENWRKLDDLQNRYFAAAQRHLWALRIGETIDKESGLPHAAHALACISFLLEDQLMNSPATPAPLKEKEEVLLPTKRPANFALVLMPIILPPELTPPPEGTVYVGTGEEITRMNRPVINRRASGWFWSPEGKRWEFSSLLDFGFTGIHYAVPRVYLEECPVLNAK